MKKLILIMSAVMLLAAGNVRAQKVAHINSQELVLALPDSKAAQETLEKLQKDAMDELQMMETIYKKKIDEYKAKAAVETTSKSVLETIQADIMEYENRIVERRSQIEQDLQKKENDLFQPILKKIKDAVAKVSKEQGVNYVFDTQVLIFYDGGLDLMPAVKKELGITTP